jgi:hypothetical protein
MAAPADWSSLGSLHAGATEPWSAWTSFAQSLPGRRHFRTTLLSRHLLPPRGGMNGCSTRLASTTTLAQGTKPWGRRSRAPSVPPASPSHARDVQTDTWMTVGAPGQLHPRRKQLRCQPAIRPITPKIVIDGLGSHVKTSTTEAEVFVFLDYRFRVSEHDPRADHGRHLHPTQASPQHELRSRHPHPQPGPPGRPPPPPHVSACSHGQHPLGAKDTPASPPRPHARFSSPRRKSPCQGRLLVLHATREQLGPPTRAAHSA